MANYHIVPHGNKWAIKKEGNKSYSKIAKTQKELIPVARRMAKNSKSELLIHGRNGKIRQKNSYGNDPRNVKG